MLSLIRPSSSLCLHQLPDSSSITVPGAPTSDALQTASTSTAATPSLHNEVKKASKPSSVASTSNTTRPTKASFLTTPIPTQLNNTSSYKDLVAQFTAKAPQPYGVIPPRRKRAPGAGLVRSSSTSVLTVSSTKNSKNNNTGSLPPSPTETVGNSVELLPTQLSSKLKTFQNNNTNTQSDNTTTNSCDGRQPQIIQPLFHSLQSFLPESTSSSTRLGFWANLKAHYLAAKATSISWPGSGSGSDNASSNNGSNQVDDAFSPPIALRLSNSTPVAAVDATAPQSASLTLTDMLLSLPNVAAPSTHAYRGSMNYPVSVAAMDKFKPIRSDTIPLKTFTYHETPVIERLPVLTHIVKTPLRKTKKGASPSTTTGSFSPPSPSSHPVTKDTKNNTTGKGNNTTQDSSLLPPLPRHLAARETRSNAAYLRMMAAELRMIRARKLISPLKPRGYLPRRKEPFQAEN
ncbi:hypothetical protein BG015_010481 [Linnemannia schmuckeri]|uniref:Uncharacterized protein n=1 Tax=Linnemannia schmuckeri TaxID=64567 RepID=A0A9P5S521_9FUNG|nr:hypothetical protein BG015_010481 [Linnemannia schmuckeri]